MSSILVTSNDAEIKRELANQGLTEALESARDASAVVARVHNHLKSKGIHAAVRCTESGQVEVKRVLHD